MEQHICQQFSRDPPFLKHHVCQQFSRDPSFPKHQRLVFLPLWRTEFSDVNSYRSPNRTFDPTANSHLSLGFLEKHLIGAPEGFFESCCGVCEQLWLVRSIGVHMDRGIPCCIHASMTIKHSKVGTVHRVLVGEQWDQTSRQLLSSGEDALQAVTRINPMVAKFVHIIHVVDT